MLFSQAAFHFSGISSSYQHVRSVGAFFVLPASTLSTDHLVLTHCDDTCFLTIAATAPGVNTTVAPRLKFTGVQSVYYKQTDYHNGSVIQESLKQYQVFPECLCTLSFSPRAQFDAVGTLLFMFDMNQPSLPIPFSSILVSVSVFMALSTVFHSINSPDIPPFSDSVLQVFALSYWSSELYITL